MQVINMKALLDNVLVLPHVSTYVVLRSSNYFAIPIRMAQNEVYAPRICDMLLVCLAIKCGAGVYLEHARV